jgi:UDP-N-acetyl-2-amino-2-deoxyglucuronate dehydrogenase
MKEQVRFGFIGAGNISRSHKEQLKNFPDVKMIAHSDPNTAAAETASKNYGGSFYADYREMIEKEQLDGVLIALPPLGKGL